MEFVVVLVVLVAVVYVITGPLRREPAAGPTVTNDHADELTDLAAAQEAKYREIRDAELDHATGKLSDEDHHAVDGRLRAEALEILNALERVQDSAGGRTVAAQPDGPGDPRQPSDLPAPSDSPGRVDPSEPSDPLGRVEAPGGEPR